MLLLPGAVHIGAKVGAVQLQLPVGAAQGVHRGKQAGGVICKARSGDQGVQQGGGGRKARGVAARGRGAKGPGIHGEQRCTLS